MRSPILLSALLAAAFAVPAPAILVRPDRDDSEYRELATRYPSSVALEPSDGEGTLIAPRWILTAGHVARALADRKPMPKLAIGGELHEIQAAFLHPDGNRDAHSDLALLLLRTPVAGVAPTPIYRDRDEDGQMVRIVGHGLTGRIGERRGSESRDRKKRAAINTVDRLTPRTLGLRIKGNDEASDLQGAAAAGDRGGPAFIETKAGIFVAGVGQSTDDTNADGILGNIGDWEIYVRVSTFAEWIDRTMWDAALRP